MTRFVVFQTAFLTLAVLSTAGRDLSAYQQDSPPAVPDEGETPSAADPLEGEPPAATRVSIEASRLSDAAGEELGPKIRPLVSTLFDSSASDDDRLAAATELRTLIPELSSGDLQKQSVARQLTRRVSLAEAGVGALKENNATDEIREVTNELLMRAAIDYEDGGREAHASIARRNYRTLRTDSPAVFKAIDTVFAWDYFNYNLHFVLSEPMMSRLVSDYRTESGGVADCILGAWVTGCQVTDTMVRADIRPSRGNASFDLVVEGRTRTDTKGRKSPATIYSKGDHGFTIRKPTYFDGTTISTANATMDVKMRTRTTGVSTDYDGIPIIAGIARKAAYKEVLRKKAQADAIAARKLANKALPRFEDEVGEKFAEANTSFQTNILENLRDRGIEPTAFSARSSETHLAVSSRTISGETLAAPRPPETPAPSRGLAVQMHQSSVNAAIDSLGISGQMTPTQVIGKIETGLSDLLNREVTIDKSEVEDKTVFDFSSSDPIRVRFSDDQVVVILRTGFVQTDRDRTVPKHLLEIPLTITLKDGKLLLIPPKTGTRDILALKPKAIEGRSSPRSVIQARAVLKELLDKTFKEPEINLDSEVELDLADGTNLRLGVTAFQLSDGWLTMVMQ